MTPTLTHIALQVPDVDEMVTFYARYCGMSVVHERAVGDAGQKVVWIAEPEKRDEMILVLLPGGATRPETAGDYSHLGFALESREAVDRVAALAASEGRLIWPPREEPYPVGYYCGVLDPTGQQVEFSYGQPLGPGAPERG
jgi:catechol 2,3-dioxygenase-like lactoylglutathione lyase family enzyme